MAISCLYGGIVGLKYVLYIWQGFVAKNPGGYPARSQQHRPVHTLRMFLKLKLLVKFQITFDQN